MVCIAIVAEIESMIKNIYKNILVFLLILLTCLNDVTAQKKKGIFKDTLDGAFDISEYMYDLHGFLPVISPITEPTVGFGGTLAGVFFIPKKEKDTTRFQMPDMVALAGGLTENDTWFAGVGYIGFWKQDRIRYRGVFGYGDINLKYYGTDNEFLSKNPIKFNLSSYFFMQQAIFRVAKSRFLLGGRYQFSKTKSKRLFPSIHIPLELAKNEIYLSFESTVL